MPENIKPMIEKVFELAGVFVEEIRFRVSKPLIIVTDVGSYGVLPDGSLTSIFGNAYIIRERDIKQLFQSVCENSVYAYLEEIKQGFITVRGGNRVGICGKAVVEDGKIENIRDISGINFRVSKEIIGSSDEIISNILKDEKIINTLIVSPPKGGKTTIIRDIARQISNAGFKVGIIDERSEIAAVYKGIHKNDVGLNTDVLDCVPRNLGIVMMLRSMSPDVLITDEIATKDDAKAVEQAIGCGVSIVATAHGESIDDVKTRKNIDFILGNGGFEQVITISRMGRSVNFSVARAE
ncbi:MAG: stage III sporulation protein AA [Clostridiales bacterium]|jgi:stage III sporulation protein AA|nr:stage III sporulation protein AA [Clostridiales bacterium]